MRENNRNPGQSEGSGPSSQQQLRGKGHGHEPVCLTPLRVVIGVLALLLLVISGMSSLAVVKNSYAVSGCGILLHCQSPTPSPSPSPSPTKTATPKPSPTKTATPNPSPTSRPTLPPVSSPTTGASPNATTSISPTAASGGTSTGVAQTPGASPTSIPATTRGNTGNQTPSQSGGGGSSRVVVIVAITFLGLLLCLGIGMFVFRRMLLPQTDVKLPPSGARPWARTRVPNPDSLGGNNNAERTQATWNVALAFATANNGFGPGPNGFEQSDNGYAPPNGSSATIQQGSDPTNNGLHAPTLVGFGPQDMNGQPPNDYSMPNNGISGFLDGFMPSPQIFPPSNASVIPPGSAALPVIPTNNGFTPASSAFNVGYGLPNDPFAPSQGGAPGWPESLEGSEGNAYG